MNKFELFIPGWFEKREEQGVPVVWFSNQVVYGLSYGPLVWSGALFYWFQAFYVDIR